MKQVKIILALILMIGIPIPIISVYLLNNEHSIWFVPISFVSSFIGTALIFGTKGFKQHPKWIGNVDEEIMPIINQNWIVYFITLIINLVVSNLCGNF